MKRPVAPGERQESPHVVRLSLGAAMTLGFRTGLFHRGVQLRCINMLMTYEGGCSANCAYCGLQKSRAGGFGNKSFIRVDWPAFPLTEVVTAIGQHRHTVSRVCISMITHARVPRDIMAILDQILPLAIKTSILLCPTVTNEDDLREYKARGVDRIGVAFDLPTPDLFDRHRGSGVQGPHQWTRFEHLLRTGLLIFGPEKVGVHLIVGLGESEQGMVARMQEIRDLGALPHLFSFFPERNSLLADASPPSAAQFRRMQLASYLITHRLGSYGQMSFNEKGELIGFGIEPAKVQQVVNEGCPFLTSGCPHCTRPYGDCMPGDDIRSFPFPLEVTDIAAVREQLGLTGELP